MERLLWKFLKEWLLPLISLNERVLWEAFLKYRKTSSWDHPFRPFRSSEELTRPTPRRNLFYEGRPPRFLRFRFLAGGSTFPAGKPLVKRQTIDHRSHCYFPPSNLRPAASIIANKPFRSPPPVASIPSNFTTTISLIPILFLPRCKRAPSTSWLHVCELRPGWRNNWKKKGRGSGLVFYLKRSRGLVMKLWNIAYKHWPLKGAVLGELRPITIKYT